MAAPCLAAGALLGVLLWRRAAAAGTPLIGCLAALVLCAGNPLTIRALEIGHPEELLGGALCVGAALAAAARRPLAAGLLLGLAVANKPWAVLAIVPVMLILPAGRMRALTAAAAAAAVVLVPLWALGSPAIAHAGAVARGGGQIFQPWQAWWFLGEHGQPVMGLFGQEKPGFRTPPGWIGAHARPLVVLVPLAVSMLVGLRWRGRPWHDGLLLLALVMLLRCLLDPWNVVYYELPFVLALVAWEVHARPGLPAISVAVTLACWVTLEALTTVISPDAQAALFLAWSVPVAVLMAVRLLKPGVIGVPRIGDAPGTAGGHGTGRMGHLIDRDRLITSTPTLTRSFPVRGGQANLVACRPGGQHLERCGRERLDRGGQAEALKLDRAGPARLDHDRGRPSRRHTAGGRRRAGVELHPQRPRRRGVRAGRGCRGRGSPGLAAITRAGERCDHGGHAEHDREQQQGAAKLHVAQRCQLMRDWTDERVQNGPGAKGIPGRADLRV